MLGRAVGRARRRPRDAGAQPGRRRGRACVVYLFIVEPLIVLLSDTASKYTVGQAQTALRGGQRQRPAAIGPGAGGARRLDAPPLVAAGAARGRAAATWSDIPARGHQRARSAGGLHSRAGMAERRLHGLQRVLGVNALFSTAYGNVGSSIYYALGLVASFALGLTPVVFVITGVIFYLTAATYAEATAMYPEAGGSSSLRPPRVQRVLVLLRRLGPDAQLRHHDRHLGVLRAALPRRRVLGRAAPQPGRHLRRHRRGRRAGGRQRARRQGVGAASTSSWRSPTS